MNIQQSPLFTRTVKKLTKQQKQDLDHAVKEIYNNPMIGEAKVGDLAGIYVYKFKLDKQLVLLANSIDEMTITLYLLKLGSHENFYRELKRD